MEPVIEHRPARAYAGITESATLAEWGRVNALVGEIASWLAEQGVSPSGPPMYRYYSGDVGSAIEVEVCWPVEGPLPPSDRVSAGALPAGRYAVLVHHGHPDRIGESFAALEAWSERTGEEWDLDGGRWGCRYETYRSDPGAEPDPARWETEIAYRLRD